MYLNNIEQTPPSMFWHIISSTSISVPCCTTLFKALYPTTNNKLFAMKNALISAPALLLYIILEGM